MNHSVTGIVERFLFQNGDNGFAVAILSTNSSNEKSITACGYLTGIQIGQEVELLGDWVVHSKFGRQFQIEKCTSKLPKSLVGLKKYLGSGAIKGIGPTYAKRLVNYFGLEVLQIIEHHPHRLHEVEGLGQKRVEKIVSAWTDQKEISNIMIFLQERDISTSLAVKIYKKYKQQSLAVLHQNPYRLADDLWGVSFKIADDLAKKMGFKHDSIERAASGIIFTITNSTQQGHLYIELQNLKKQAEELLGLNSGQNILKKALHSLYEQDKIKLLTHEDLHYITLKKFYLSELGVAEKIKKLNSYKNSHTIDLGNVYKSLVSNEKKDQQESEVELNEKQQQGILTCLENKVTVITGGPGTGKTTLIKKLLEVLHANKLTYKLAAPTGRAAKRIMESTKKQAFTIHRLLDFNPITGQFNHNESNALDTDFLIIDEASMIDIFLAHSILKAISYKTNIVFIGDIDQLPSVGAGSFLNDIISSNKIACVRLTQIFRQAQDSLIILNAHKINHGQYPNSSLPGSKEDYSFIKEENPESISNHLKKIIYIDLPKWGIKPSQMAILCPMNRGLAGAHLINSSLQEILNHKNKSSGIAIGSQLFCLNDRVMQIRNNYNKHVYNGDIGYITDINKIDKEMVITFDSLREVIYEFDELNEITLAYAISIHKSQGSEFPAVVVPIFVQHYMLLQRKLIYTALTRAKKRCIFIGQTKALAMAINNNKSIERLTFLKKFLEEDTINY